MATVNQLQTAANMVYGDGSGPKTLGAGWQQINGIAIATDARNGYQGAAWFNASTGEVIIANRGTQPTNLANLQSDVGITLHQPIEAQTSANNYAQAVVATIQNAYPNTPIQVYTTGHSLGGTEAQGQNAALYQTGVTNVISAVFDSPGANVANTQGGKVFNFYSTTDTIHLAGGSDLNGTIQIPLNTGQSSAALGGPLLYLVNPALGLAGTTFSAYTTLSAHADGQVMNAISQSALGALDMHTLSSLNQSQVQALSGMTAHQFQVLPTDQQTALLSKSATDMTTFIGGLPKDTPSYDSAGYSQLGYDKNGYNIYGRNAAGFLDPSVGKSGSTRAEMTADGSQITTIINSDGSATTTINASNGTVYKYQMDTNGHPVSVTTTNQDGSGNTMVLNPATGTWTDVQNNADGSSVQSSGQENKDGSYSESALVVSSGGITNGSEKLQKNSDGSETSDFITNNASGFKQFEVATTIQANGSETDFVSGTGAQVNFTNATITLANGASATVAGNNNELILNANTSFTIQGQNETIATVNAGIANIQGILSTASASSVVLASNGSLSETLNGVGVVSSISNASITLANGTNATINGNGNQVTAGSNVTANIFGQNDNATIAGNGSTLTAYGNNDKVIATGSSDNAYTTGTNSLSEVDGSNSVALATGAGSMAKATGANDIAQAQGANSTALATGIGDTASVTGANSKAEVDGANSFAWSNNSGDIADAKGANSKAQATGANSTAEVEGANSTAITTGVGDTAMATGASSQAQAQGASSNAITTGLGDTASVTGANSKAESDGASSFVWSSGVGDIADAKGISSKAVATGANSTAEVDGDNSVAITTGVGDTAKATGSGDQAQAQGANSNALTTGLNDTASATGDNSSAEADGANSMAWTSGAGDFADVKGANSTASISGANSTAEAEGANGTFNKARDFDGDHIADQTESNKIDANGNRVDDLKDFTKGILKDETLTTTSADLQTVTTQKDLEGDSKWNNIDVAKTNADGSKTDDYKDLNTTGATLDETLTSLSADKKSTTVQTDANGDGTFEKTAVTLDANLDGKADKISTTTLNADKSSTLDVVDYATTGAKADEILTATSADQKTVTTQKDSDGDGKWNNVDVVKTNADGTKTDDYKDLNVSGVTLDEVLTSVSSDKKTTTIQTDANGDGSFEKNSVVLDANLDGKSDKTTTTTFNVDGSKTVDLVDYVTSGSSVGAKLDETLTSTNALGTVTTVAQDTNGDGKIDITTISTDANKDGKVDFFETIGTDGTGARIDDLKAYNASGAIQYDQTTVTATNGSISITVSGTGDILNQSNATITLTDGAQATVNGSSNIIKAGNNDTLTENGSGNTFTGGTGDVVNAVGNNNTLTLGTSGTLNATGTGEVVNASGDQVNLGNGTTATLNGSSNAVNAGSNSTLIENGASNMTIGGTGDAITVNGNSETLTVGTGSTLTVTGTGEVINASSDRVNIGNSSTATLNGSGNTVSAGSNDSLVENGSSNTTTGGTGDVVTEVGNSNTLTLGTGSTINATGSGEVINASSDRINLGNSSSATVNGSSNTVVAGNNDTLVENGSSNTTTGGTGDVIAEIGNNDTLTTSTGSTLTVTGTGEVINASSDRINLGNNTTVTINGSSDTTTGGTGDRVTENGNNDSLSMGSGGSIYANGTGETINASSDTISFGAYSTGTINGSYDSISGAGHNSLSVNGIYDPVSDSYSTVNYSGGNTGDIVTGSGDTGGDWYTPYVPPTYYSSSSSSGTAGSLSTVVSRLGSSLSIASPDSKNGLSEVTGVIASGYIGEVQNNVNWKRSALTWSLTASVGQAAFSENEIASINEAFGVWSAASGVTFNEVADGSGADINLSFKTLNTSTSGLLGLTTIQNFRGVTSSAQIALEDTGQDSLSNDANMTYSGTDATFEQLVLHEIGHALGLSDNNQYGSIENYYLGASNQSLSDSDVAAIRSIYNPARGSANSSLVSVNQLIQAMASFSVTASAQIQTSIAGQQESSALQLAVSH